MGVVKYATGIQYVSGSLSKPTVKAGHSHGNYLTGTHRIAPTSNPDCTRLYVREADTYKRTTPVGADEQRARIRFAAVSAAVKARKADLIQMNTDQEAFLAQKNSKNGIPTMKKYLWKVCGDAYDAEHPQG